MYNNIPMGYGISSGNGPDRNNFYICFLESRLIFLVNCNEVISLVVILFYFFLFWCFGGKEIELLYSSPAFLSNIDTHLVDWCSKRII